MILKTFFIIIIKKNVNVNTFIYFRNFYLQLFTIFIYLLIFRGLCVNWQEVK